MPKSSESTILGNQLGKYSKSPNWVMLTQTRLQGTHHSQGSLQNSPLIPLSDAALAELQESTTLISLAALLQADINARVNNQHEINPQMIKSAWASILPLPSDPIKNFVAPEKPSLDTIRQIIAQKIKSYEKYNKITTPVFLRNI